MRLYFFIAMSQKYVWPLAEKNIKCNISHNSHIGKQFCYCRSSWDLLELMVGPYFMANGIEQTNGKKVEGFRCILTPKSSKLIEVEMIDELFSFPLKLSIDVREIWSNFYWLNVASQRIDLNTNDKSRLYKLDLLVNCYGDQLCFVETKGLLQLLCAM